MSGSCGSEFGNSAPREGLDSRRNADRLCAVAAELRDGAQTAIGGHCSVNGTPPRKPSAQPLPPEIEIRDRDR